MARASALSRGRAALAWRACRPHPAFPTALIRPTTSSCITYNAARGFSVSLPRCERVQSKPAPSFSESALSSAKSDLASDGPQKAFSEMAFAFEYDSVASHSLMTIILTVSKHRWSFVSRKARYPRRKGGASNIESSRCSLCLPYEWRLRP